MNDFKERNGRDYNKMQLKKISETKLRNFENFRWSLTGVLLGYDGIPLKKQ